MQTLSHMIRSIFLVAFINKDFLVVLKQSNMLFFVTWLRMKWRLRKISIILKLCCLQFVKNQFFYGFSLSRDKYWTLTSIYFILNVRHILLYSISCIRCDFILWLKLFFSETAFHSLLYSRWNVLFQRRRFSYQPNLSCKVGGS